MCMCLCDSSRTTFCCLSYRACFQLLKTTMSLDCRRESFLSWCWWVCCYSCFSVGLLKKRKEKNIVIIERCKLYIWNEFDPSYDDNRLILSRMSFLSLRKSESTHNHQHSNRFWSASRKTAVNVSEWLCTWVSHVWMYYMYKIFFFFVLKLIFSIYLAYWQSTVDYPSNKNS